MGKKTRSFPTIIVVIAVFVVVVIAVSYFYFFKSRPSLPKVSEKEFADIKDPLIRKHLTAQYGKTEFKTKTLSSGKGSGPTVTEYQQTGNELKMSTVSYDDAGKEESHLVWIGELIYIKDYKDGKWWREKSKPVPTGKTQEGDGTVKPEDIRKKYSDTKKIEYKQLGKEKCGNLTCYKYEQIDPENKEGKRTFWFDNREYLLRKDQYTFGEFITTNEYSYDNINVSHPSPVKDVPEGKSIYEYLNSSYQAPQTDENYQQQIEEIKKNFQDIPQSIPTYNPSEETENQPPAEEYSGE